MALSGPRVRLIPESVAAHTVSGRTVHDRNQQGRTQVYQDSLTLPGSANQRPKTLTSCARIADGSTRSSQREEPLEYTG